MNTPVMAVRLDESLQAQIKRMALAAGKTKSDIIRELIIQAIQTGTKQSEQPAISGK